MNLALHESGAAHHLSTLIRPGLGGAGCGLGKPVTGRSPDRSSRAREHQVAQDGAQEILLEATIRWDTEPSPYLPGPIRGSVVDLWEEASCEEQVMRT
jgi:hypothetical protein